jgi:predicted esterase
VIQLFLHGFASSAAQFRAAFVGSPWAERKDARFLEAPDPEPMSGHRRWFPFTGSESRLAASLVASAPRVEAEIARIIANAGATGLGIHLHGHSQGGMLALELACRARLPIASVRCFAAFLPEPERWSGRCSADTRVTVFSSCADRYVPRASVVRSVAALRARGVRTLDHVATGLSHGFSSAWLDPMNFEEQP